MSLTVTYTNENSNVKSQNSQGIVKLALGYNNKPFDLHTINGTNFIVKIGNDDGYIGDINIDTTNLNDDQKYRGTFSFPLSDQLIQQLPPGIYYLEVWVNTTDQNGQTKQLIFPSDDTVPFTLTPNIVDGSNSLPMITFDRVLQAWDDFKNFILNHQAKVEDDIATMDYLTGSFEDKVNSGIAGYSGFADSAGSGINSLADSGALKLNYAVTSANSNVADINSQIDSAKTQISGAANGVYSVVDSDVNSAEQAISQVTASASSNTGSNVNSAEYIINNAANGVVNTVNQTVNSAVTRVDNAADGIRGQVNGIVSSGDNRINNTAAGIESITSSAVSNASYVSTSLNSVADSAVRNVNYTVNSADNHMSNFANDINERTSSADVHIDLDTSNADSHVDSVTSSADSHVDLNVYKVDNHANSTMNSVDAHADNDVSMADAHMDSTMNSADTHMSNFASDINDRTSSADAHIDMDVDHADAHIDRDVTDADNHVDSKVSSGDSVISSNVASGEQYINNHALNGENAIDRTVSAADTDINNNASNNVSTVNSVATSADNYISSNTNSGVSRVDNDITSGENQVSNVVSSADSNLTSHVNSGDAYISDKADSLTAHTDKDMNNIDSHMTSLFDTNDSKTSSAVSHVDSDATSVTNMAVSYDSNMDSKAASAYNSLNASGISAYDTISNSAQSAYNSITASASNAYAGINGSNTAASSAISAETQSGLDRINTLKSSANASLEYDITHAGADIKNVVTANVTRNVRGSVSDMVNSVDADVTNMNGAINNLNSTAETQVAANAAHTSLNSEVTSVATATSALTNAIGSNAGSQISSIASQVGNFNDHTGSSLAEGISNANGAITSLSGSTNNAIVNGVNQVTAHADSVATSAINQANTNMENNRGSLSARGDDLQNQINSHPNWGDENWTRNQVAPSLANSAVANANGYTDNKANGLQDQINQNKNDILNNASTVQGKPTNVVDDLNKLMTSGYYDFQGVNNENGTNQIKNIPKFPSMNTGWFDVRVMTNSAGIYQIVYSFMSNDIFMRCSNTGGANWTDWSEVSQDRMNDLQNQIKNRPTWDDENWTRNNTIPSAANSAKNEAIGHADQAATSAINQANVNMDVNRNNLQDQINRGLPTNAQPSGNVDDLNDLNSPGFYQFNGVDNIKHLPSGYGMNDGWFIVHVLTFGAGPIQILYSFMNNDLFMRSTNAGGNDWNTDWEEIKGNYRMDDLQNQINGKHDDLQNQINNTNNNILYHGEINESYDFATGTLARGFYWFRGCSFQNSPCNDGDWGWVFSNFYDGGTSSIIIHDLTRRSIYFMTRSGAGNNPWQQVATIDDINGANSQANQAATNALNQANANMETNRSNLQDEINHVQGEADRNTLNSYFAPNNATDDLNYLSAPGYYDFQGVNNADGSRIIKHMPNFPSVNTGWFDVQVMTNSAGIYQIFYSFMSNDIYMRSSNTGGAQWTDWTEIGSDGRNDLQNKIDVLHDRADGIDNRIEDLDRKNHELDIRIQETMASKQELDTVRHQLMDFVNEHIATVNSQIEDIMARLH